MNPQKVQIRNIERQDKAVESCTEMLADFAQHPVVLTESGHVRRIVESDATTRMEIFFHY